MKIKAWHIILTGGVSAYFFSKATKIKNLQFNFDKVHIDGLKGLNLTGKLDYTVTNPTSSEITIQFFRGKIYYGSFLLSNIVINQVVLAPGESKNLTVNFSSSLLLLAYNIQAIIESKWLLYQFHVIGDLVYKVQGLPQITVKIDSDIPLSEKYEKGKTP